MLAGRVSEGVVSSAPLCAGGAVEGGGKVLVAWEGKRVALVTALVTAEEGGGR